MTRTEGVCLRNLSVFVAIAALLAAAPLIWGGKADDNPSYGGGYRGVDRTGVYPADGLIRKWPQDGPKLLWTYDKLAVAWSSVTVWDGKAYVLGGTEPGRLYCLNVADGRLLFAKGYGPDRKEGRFPAARSTVEIHGGRAYFASGDGVIHCLDASTGDPVWSVDTVKAFANKVPGHGYNLTPLIHDGKLICAIRRGKHTHVALDLKTGDVVWASEPSTLAIGDSSPVLVPHEKQPLILDNLWHALVAIDPDSGKIVWQHKEGRTGTMMTPVVRGDKVLADMGGHRAVLFERTTDGDAPFRKVWKLDNGLDDISQALILDGKVFYLRRGQREVERKETKNGKTITRKVREKYMALEARDLETGKVLQTTAVRASGSLSAADGMIYLVTGGEKRWQGSDGIEAWISLVRPTQRGFEIVSEFKPVRAKKEVWVNAAIADGRLFFRQGRRISCYDLRPASYGDSLKPRGD